MTSNFTTIAYNNSDILYQPDSAWKSVIVLDENNVPTTVKQSTVANSSITFKFRGLTNLLGTDFQVNVWLNSDAANYTAYIDGDTITRPHASSYLSPTRIQGDVSWRNLTDKEYTLRLVKTPDDPSWTPSAPGTLSHLSFDSFFFNGTALSPPPADPTTSASASSSSSTEPTSPSNPSHSTPVGAAVRGVIGALAVLILLVILGIWLWVRRRRRQRMVFPKHEPFVDRNASVGEFMRSKGLHDSHLGSSSTLNLMPLASQPASGGVGSSPDSRRKESEGRERRDRGGLREKQPLPGVPSTNASNTAVNRHNTLFPLPGNRFIRVASTSQHSSSDATAISSPPALTTLTTSNTAGSDFVGSSNFTDLTSPPVSQAPTQTQPTHSSYSSSMPLSSIEENQSEDPSKPSRRSASVPRSPDTPKTPRSANREQGQGQGFGLSAQPANATGQRLSIAKPPIPTNIRTDVSPTSGPISGTLMTASSPESNPLNIHTEGSGPTQSAPAPIIRLGLHNPDNTSPSSETTPNTGRSGGGGGGGGGRRTARTPPRPQQPAAMDPSAANSLLHEMAVLRAQVRNLEEMRRQYEGDEEIGDEPPPEYDDEEDEEESRAGHGDPANSRRTRQDAP